VDGVELFLLGRTLMKIGEEALPVDGIGTHTTSVRTVLIVASDVRVHPGSAVGEIVRLLDELARRLTPESLARFRD
jgi:hypothetical protein